MFSRSSSSVNPRVLCAEANLENLVATLYIVKPVGGKTLIIRKSATIPPSDMRYSQRKPFFLLFFEFLDFFKRIILYYIILYCNPEADCGPPEGRTHHIRLRP